MPQCRLPDGTVIGVSSCAECDRTYNGECLGDATPGTIHFNIPCFVRNVLIRTLADALLDVGSADSVSEMAIESLVMGAERERPPSAETGLRPLTPELREDLARQITGGIMQLAATYRTTVDFRDRILLTSPRGIELKEHYDRQLGEIYHVAARDLDLVREAAATWLAVHPFVASMVSLTGENGSAEDERTTFSTEQHQRCVALFRRFRDASEDVPFRQILDEVERELSGYEKLTAQESLAKLAATTPMGQAPTDRPDVNGPGSVTGE